MGGGGYNRRNLARAWTRVVEALRRRRERSRRRSLSRRQLSADRVAPYNSRPPTAEVADVSRQT